MMLQERTPGHRRTKQQKKSCRTTGRLTFPWPGDIIIIVPIIRRRTSIERDARYRQSRQRNRLLEALRETGDHPTADVLYRRLKPEFPNLSLGTVYRNLTILAEQGLVKKLDFGSTFDRFEAKTAPHYHFVCERCGSVSDLELPVDESLNERVSRETPYVARRHRIEFYGICDECKTYEIDSEL